LLLFFFLNCWRQSVFIKGTTSIHVGYIKPHTCTRVCLMYNFQTPSTVYPVLTPKLSWLNICTFLSLRYKQELINFFLFFFFFWS
jgi:hypothetical protein